MLSTNYITSCPCFASNPGFRLIKIHVGKVRNDMPYEQRSTTILNAQNMSIIQKENANCNKERVMKMPRI